MTNSINITNTCGKAGASWTASVEDNVDLEFTDDALDLIADKAMSRKTGARGLRTIVENILKDTMFEVPSKDNVDKVIIDVKVSNKDKKLDTKIQYKGE